MKRSVARKWISALRSGAYKKVTGVLKKVGKNQNESFCALGVLCDIYQKEHVRGLPEEPAKDDWGKNCVSIDDEKFHLPTRVMKWAGLKTKTCSIRSENTNIPTLNDDGVSFKEIADIIETNQDKI